MSLREQDSVVIRADYISTVRSLSQGLSFEDKWGMIGVAPPASGLHVATAAGAAGAIVPVTGATRQTIPPAVERGAGRKKSAWSRRLSKNVVDSVEILSLIHI